MTVVGHVLLRGLFLSEGGTGTMLIGARHTWGDASGGTASERRWILGRVDIVSRIPLIVETTKSLKRRHEFERGNRKKTEDGVN